MAEPRRQSRVNTARKGAKDRPFSSPCVPQSKIAVHIDQQNKAEMHAVVGQGRLPTQNEGCAATGTLKMMRATPIPSCHFRSTAGILRADVLQWSCIWIGATLWVYSRAIRCAYPARSFPDKRLAVGGAVTCAVSMERRMTRTMHSIADFPDLTPRRRLKPFAISPVRCAPAAGSAPCTVWLHPRHV